VSSDLGEGENKDLRKLSYLGEVPFEFTGVSFSWSGGSRTGFSPNSLRENRIIVYHRSLSPWPGNNSQFRTPEKLKRSGEGKAAEEGVTSWTRATRAKLYLDQV